MGALLRGGWDSFSDGIAAENRTPASAAAWAGGVDSASGATFSSRGSILLIL